MKFGSTPQLDHRTHFTVRKRTPQPSNHQSSRGLGCLFSKEAGEDDIGLFGKKAVPVVREALNRKHTLARGGVRGGNNGTENTDGPETYDHRTSKASGRAGGNSSLSSLEQFRVEIAEDAHGGGGGRDFHAEL